jgi:hypothetical protein
LTPEFGENISAFRIHSLLIEDLGDIFMDRNGMVRGKVTKIFSPNYGQKGIY